MHYTCIKRKATILILWSSTSWHSYIKTFSSSTGRLHSIPPHNALTTSMESLSHTSYPLILNAYLCVCEWVCVHSFHLSFTFFLFSFPHSVQKPERGNMKGPPTIHFFTAELSPHHQRVKTNLDTFTTKLYFHPFSVCVCACVCVTTTFFFKNVYLLSKHFFTDE